MEGRVDVTAKFNIREGDALEIALVKEMEGVKMERGRDTAIEARQRMGGREERENQGVGGIKPADNVKDAEMLEEKEEMGEGDEVVQEPCG